MRSVLVVLLFVGSIANAGTIWSEADIDIHLLYGDSSDSYSSVKFHQPASFVDVYSRIYANENFTSDIVFEQVQFEDYVEVTLIGVLTDVETEVQMFLPLLNDVKVSGSINYDVRINMNRNLPTLPEPSALMLWLPALFGYLAMYSRVF